MLNSLSIVSTAVDAGAATITKDMLTPLVDGVVANIGVILPVGIGLFALFLGIALIPKLMKKFTNH